MTNELDHEANQAVLKRGGKTESFELMAIHAHVRYSLLKFPVHNFLGA